MKPEASSTKLRSYSDVKADLYLIPAPEVSFLFECGLDSRLNAITGHSAKFCLFSTVFLIIKRIKSCETRR